MTHKKKTKQPDILLCGENKQGCDYAIANPEGNEPLLRELISKLKRNDRLFIAGGLCGRDQPGRPGSFALIQLLNKIKSLRGANPDAEVPEVIVSRGNGEKAFLKAYPILMSKKGDNGPLEKLKKAAEDKAIKLYRKNKKNKKNASSKMQTLAALKKQYVKNAEEQAKKYHAKFIADGGQWAEAAERTAADLTAVHDYFISLRTGVVIPGEREFSTWYSDAPISAIRLKEKIKTNDLTLTNDEKHYAMYAREVPDGKPTVIDRRNGRTPRCPLAVVGNNALMKMDEKGILVREEKHSVIRAKTNTINLNVKAAYGNTFLLLNITKGMVQQFGNHQKQLVPVTQAIQKHLLTIYPEQMKVVGKFFDEKIKARVEEEFKKENKEIENVSAAEYKNKYITELKTYNEILSPTDRKALAYYLLTKDDHKLAREDSWLRRKIWSEYSHQTRAMHKAISILTGDFYKKEGDKVTLVFDDFVGRPTFDLSRHVKEEFIEPVNQLRLGA